LGLSRVNFKTLEPTAFVTALKTLSQKRA